MHTLIWYKYRYIPNFFFFFLHVGGTTTLSYFKRYYIYTYIYMFQIAYEAVSKQDKFTN